MGRLGARVTGIEYRARCDLGRKEIAKATFQVSDALG
jgi:hypothetical protein